MTPPPPFPPRLASTTPFDTAEYTLPSILAEGRPTARAP